MQMNNYEEAASNHSMEGNYIVAACDTSSEIISIDETWKKMITVMDANEKETRLMKNHHERSVKMVKTLWKKMKA